MASVIKHDITGTSAAAQPVAFNVEDVQTKAREYLAEVQQQADQMLAQARAEAEQIRADALSSGIAQAQADFEKRVEETAQQKSDAACKTAISACEEAITGISQSTTEWLSQWRQQTVTLAGRIAEKLVRQQMQENDELLRAWLEEALVAMRDARYLRVLVHPDDFAVAGRFLTHLAKSVPQAAEAEVVPDPEVSLGGCIVRSEHGQFDQCLETQLQRLVEQLG